jgi:hypothetical protein
MEVCGGQTHAKAKFGLDELLPKQVTLIHGPGCPVCVTPVELVDKALEIPARPGVIFCSLGDMLRVHGSNTDLLAVKAAGGDVRGACGIPGLDPFQVACEGYFAAFKPKREIERVLELQRPRPDATGTCKVGTVSNRRTPKVALKSAIGTQRFLDMPAGEQLPRIC